MDRVVYSSDESGWTVVRLAVDGAPAPVTAVGTLGGARPGENLRLSGRWVTDRTYGEQFRVDSFMILLPSTLAGIEKYLASGFLPGIGPVMARRLLKRFGLETLDVMEKQPERLAEVRGLGPVRREGVCRAWLEHRAARDVMVFLHSHGISPGLAGRIYRAYGERAPAAIRENPYRLAVEIDGIGFLTADRIAVGLGVPPTSPQRAHAAVAHVLGEASEEGHVFLPRPMLAERTTRLLGPAAGSPDDAERAIDFLRKEGRVVFGASGGGENAAVYLRLLFEAERGAARRLLEILSAPPRQVRIDTARAVAWFEAREKIALGLEQRQALERALSSKVLVLTGGPGTGKTTLVRGIVQILEKKGLRILLCAPTGRAARRLSEVAGREARTIHRLLEFNPRTMQFQRNRERTLDADLLVVDETSMVDIPLFHHLLEAVPEACRLLLAGDAEQLPSVGPGNVLHDLIRSGTVTVCRMTEIFRQAAESRIVLNAHRVNRGEMPLFGEEGGRGDFFFIERQEPEAALETIKALVARRIPSRFGLDAVDDVQVLTPMRKGLLGATSLNAELQRMFSGPPPAEASGAGGPRFRPGDKVMQVRNNYELDVFNGDIGRVERSDTGERRVVVRFEDRMVAYEPAELDQLALAYACTIHKSQGSEYPAAVIALHTQHAVMLQRNLLYTALTRGKKVVVLVGSRKALAMAVRNNRVRQRYSRLAERLQAPGGPAPPAGGEGRSRDGEERAPVSLPASRPSGRRPRGLSAPGRTTP